MSEEWDLERQAPAREEGAPAQPQPPKGSDFFFFLQTITVALVCVVLALTFLGRMIRVDGSSMDNTLADGELIAVWSAGYEPKQGDIVVVNKSPVTFLGGGAIIKRVIALEGQTVDIDYASNTVYVDGEPLDEPYLPEKMERPDSPYMQSTHWEVPEDCIFVLGDNRNNSTDSRDDRLGFIHEDYVLGRAMVVLWPLGRLGLL